MMFQQKQVNSTVLACFKSKLLKVPSCVRPWARQRGDKSDEEKSPA